MRWLLVRYWIDKTVSTSTLYKSPKKGTNLPERIYLSPPHMSPRERELLLEAFDSNWIAPLGPHVDAFEQEFSQLMDGLEAVALSSGTAALHIVLRMLDVRPGDVVLTSSLTFAATANVITYMHAEPIFIDSEPRTWNMDPQLLADELARLASENRLPKAVIVVDIYGQCADYAAIHKVCAEYDVPLIEDAAEALGASYQGHPAGTFGRFGCFSFNGNKILTTSGGGMLVCPDKQSAQRARFLATQARDPAPHYEHSEVGYNYRLSNLLAAIGRGQLSVLQDRVERRRENCASYQAALGELPGITFMPEPEEFYSTRWLTCIVVAPDQFGATREDIRLALERENIESRPIWKPMHMQPVFQKCRVCGGRFSEQLFRDGLCLPSGSSLTDSDQQRVIDIVRDCYRAR
jgi:dTDP-4-amino-4,6-dideoxygalactose transaminase